MKFKPLFTVFSLISFISGLGCFLAPEMMLASFGVSLPPMGIVVYQFWGSTLIGLGLVGWFARTIEEVKFHGKASTAMLITSILGTYLAVQGQFNGANDMGWSMVGLYGLFSLGFGSFLVVRRS